MSELLFFATGLFVGIMAPLTGIAGGVITSFIFLTFTKLTPIQVVYVNSSFLFCMSVFNLFLLRNVSILNQKAWLRMHAKFVLAFTFLGSFFVSYFPNVSLFFIIGSATIPLFFLLPFQTFLKQRLLYSFCFVLGGAGAGLSLSLSLFLKSVYGDLWKDQQQVKLVFICVFFHAIFLILGAVAFNFFAWSQTYLGSENLKIAALTGGALLGSYVGKKLFVNRKSAPLVRLYLLIIIAFLTLASALFRLY